MSEKKEISHGEYWLVKGGICKVLLHDPGSNPIVSMVGIDFQESKSTSIMEEKALISDDFIRQITEEEFFEVGAILAKVAFFKTFGKTCDLREQRGKFGLWFLEMNGI